MDAGGAWAVEQLENKFLNKRVRLYPPAFCVDDNTIADGVWRVSWADRQQIELTFLSSGHGAMLSRKDIRGFTETPYDPDSDGFLRLNSRVLIAGDAVRLEPI
jgi:hypothetical protein